MDIRATIVGLLKKQPLKPGELAEKLGISRQALHRHLGPLVAAKRIHKNGSGPHVVYSATSSGLPETRVRGDYLFCREYLLPRYVDRYADGLDRYMKRLARHTTRSDTVPDFRFLLDAAAVYSSKIEGNTLDLNSFLNSRLSPRKHRPKEAQEIEDLVSAYVYAKKRSLTEKNMLHAHAMLSREFVALTRRGRYREEPVGVFSQRGLEYMAVESSLVKQEMHELFSIVSALLRSKQSAAECFFWASWLHLTIALIHPFSDGNGRTARLCEKWFLATTLGETSFHVPGEETYWHRRSAYYAALKLGVNYWETDMHNALPFFALLPEDLAKIP